MPSRKIKESERRRCPQACGSCKRRKERCDGRQPCSRCTRRGVQHDCFFSRPVESAHERRVASLASPESAASSGSASLGRAGAGWQRPPRSQSPHDISVDIEAPRQDFVGGRADGGHRPRAPQVFSATRSAPVPQLSRLIQSGKGSLVFIGDSANLCFLQTIRRLVRESLGPCTFTDDPLRHMLVEATPTARPSWIAAPSERPPSIPTHADAHKLLNWFLRATNCVLNLFDEFELKENLSRWLQQKQLQSTEPTDDIDSSERDPTGAIFFLIFAIGSQTSPEDHDEMAEDYFDYGRYLTMPWAIEEPDLNSIQAYVLITMFLLGASRRNAAFMYLSIAVRAAYALGIHRDQANAIFDHAECASRERLWRVLRVLDLFMSASMGRPPSTVETRDTKAEGNYSASNDLCAIFEEILTDVYSRRMVSTVDLERISEHHRFWSTRFSSGLSIDGIHPGEFAEVEGVKEPNIGLYHLKEAYYWTIMLLSQPFLIENVSRHISRGSPAGQATPHDADTSSHAASDQILAYACIDSAIRTLDLLRGLLPASSVPKRLPFVVNSVFVSALVLGLAQFGDLDRVFTLDKNLTLARHLLSLFSSHDPLAQRYLTLVTDLQAACGTYVEKRARRKMERPSMLISGLFGTVDEGHRKSLQCTTEAPEAEAMLSTPKQTSVRQPRHPDMELTPPVTDTDEAATTWQGSAMFGAPIDPDGQHFLDLGDNDGMQMLPDLTDLADMVFAMSPRTLEFDSYARGLPLFPTMDASMLRTGEDLIIGDTRLGLEM